MKRETQEPLLSISKAELRQYWDIHMQKLPLDSERERERIRECNFCFHPLLLSSYLFFPAFTPQITSFPSAIALEWGVNNIYILFNATFFPFFFSSIYVESVELPHCVLHHNTHNDNGGPKFPQFFLVIAVEGRVCLWWWGLESDTEFCFCWKVRFTCIFMWYQIFWCQNSE